MEIWNRPHAPPNFQILREFGNLGEIENLNQITAITTAQNLNCEARFEPKTDDRSAREKKQEFLTSSVLPHTQYESHLAEGGVVVRSELNKLVE